MAVNSNNFIWKLFYNSNNFFKISLSNPTAQNVTVYIVYIFVEGRIMEKITKKINNYDVTEQIFKEIYVKIIQHLDWGAKERLD